MLAPWMVLMVACAGTPDRSPRGPYRLDSATQACTKRPELCARMVGEEALVPTARTVGVVASAAKTGVVVLRVLDVATRDRVEEALVNCAEYARSKVLLDHLNGVPPTAKQCGEFVEDPASGRRITRAMLLGCLMHEEALACTREALDERLPRRFSLEQRYRYDPASGAVHPVSAEEAHSLLRRGCGYELKGTLVPDVVIHLGEPHQVQSIYDFKFPCVSSDDIPRWREYEAGHPYYPFNQGNMYEKAFGSEVFRVVPRIGIVR
ncbi:hypothetical protein [Pyxidicoccus fallax]|uniref:Uncharacterized protein n=1 Tax=Pyxidicoccus fallax TaxID=394095 RepID=A0A848LTH1_9BACT|nr:hypothetical protein [Pyxidicoccus fallax]NMO20694.1 hypothetical protein [Pyxidicoccus fallax]